MILFIAAKDYSNVGYGFAKALQSVGVEARAITMWRRKTRAIDEQAELSKAAKAVRLCEEAKDWVVFMHSHFPWKGELSAHLTGKRIAVFHGGTRYRMHTDTMNAFWNERVDLSLIQMPSIMGLGAKNEHWMIPAVDTEILKPVHVDNSPMLVVGHFPTGMSKGRLKVNLSVSRARKRGARIVYKTSKDILLWENHVARMRECDVIVDKVEQMYMGKMTGEWAVTTLEAAALGKIPVVTFNSEERYKKVYGPHGIERVDDVAMLINKLDALAKMEPELLREKQQKAREWVVRCHSLEATGRRLQKLLR